LAPERRPAHKRRKRKQRGAERQPPAVQQTVMTADAAAVPAAPPRTLRPARQRDWSSVKSALDLPWLLFERLRVPALPQPWERIFGANALLWVGLLIIIPIIYVGFGMTVSVNRYGLPRNLYPWIDNDYWWHLATGDRILHTHHIPRNDPWLYTYTGHWVAHEWLGGLTVAITDRLGGYRAGIILTWIIATAGFWMVNLAVRVYGLSWRACFILSALWLGVFVREGVFAVRPQMWTFSFFSILFLAIAMYDTGRWRKLWILPPLFLLWFNLHLSVVIGLFSLGIFGLDQLIRKRLTRHLVIVGLLCGVGLILNPYPLDALDLILEYRGHPALWNERIFEWQAPDFSQRFNWPFALAIPVAIPAVWQLIRLRVWPAVPLLLTLYLALDAVRFVPIYVLFALIFAGWLVWQHRLDRPIPFEAPSPLVPRQPWLLLPIAVSVAIVLGVALTYSYSQFREEPVAWGYPVEPANMVLNQFPDARIFNTYDFGGYLNHRFDGNPKIYIDGRNEVYPDELLARYFRVVDGNREWQDEFSVWDIDTAITRPIDGLSYVLANQPNWELVYQGNGVLMFRRRS
jgi:hypothetical protein